MGQRQLLYYGKEKFQCFHPRKREYLFAICQLGIEGNQVPSSMLASFLKVKRPSISKMQNALTADGQIQKEFYGEITFTPQGFNLRTSFIPTRFGSLSFLPKFWDYRKDTRSTTH
ncbi:MAG: hypothetical protein E7518_09160 [Ruminococcaceae bacterium]|nr:hypothetical protein [Oscillospiraceae bacterium]HHV32967.1 hypothetical protein [Clostridiales bacterium]